MTQKEIVLKVLEDANHPSLAWKEGWVKSYDLQKINTPYGFLGTSGDRRARELVEEGAIQSRDCGKFAEFRLWR